MTWIKGEDPHTDFGRLKRSELMSRVRSCGNTTTEGRLAEVLREAGVTGWRQQAPITGKPDFAWPEVKVAVFVDGCFWHGHDCGRKLSPRNSRRLWEKKFRRNKLRDRTVTRELRAAGWSVVRIWECELRKRPRHAVRRIKRVITLRGKRGDK
jgi:DNA mismatch endonuclease, patch repair protein